MKLTRHNGRSGKHGTYNPRHNDRRFDVENSEHIDAERARQNVYWDCYRGFTTHDFRENPEQPDFSFEEIERMYYYEHYADHVNAQNARNEKTRHIERNRTVDDLLKNNKTCPEESIYQIGTMEESVPPETLALIVSEFYEEFENRFGSHIHILDWALHLDEGTPHIHERHVFDCEIGMESCAPSRKRRWRNWVSLSLNRNSQKESTITGNRLLMQSVGQSYLTLPNGMGCIWNRSRLMVGVTIWKSRIIS